jgi:hypothetical protein
MLKGPSMDERARDAIGALEGRCLWGRGRAVEMEMLLFGQRVTLESEGRTRTVGEWALHLTGGWRITSNGRVLAGYRDYWIPPVGLSDEDFDPDVVGRSRRDELMEQFEAHGEEAHHVESARLSDVADLRLQFADGCVLEAFTDLGFVEPSDEVDDECWRLFQPATDRPHLFVRPGGELVVA